MNKIKRSKKLLKAAFQVLFREKKLLLFPVIATALALVVALFFIAPIVLYPTGHSYFSAAHWSALAEKVAPAFAPAHAGPHQPMLMGRNGVALFTGHWWGAAFFALAYFTSMFLATFSNVAFYHEIMQALSGQAVSVRRGFRFAVARWQAILLWSLFAGLVGYLINAIEERVGFLGRFITGFIGLAWSVACIFVIPTLVRNQEESPNPLKLLRTSAGTLKRTWGELVIGYAGMELAFGLGLLLLLLVTLLTGGLGTYLVCSAFHLGLWWILLVAVGELLGLMALLGTLGSVVNPVYRCALFVYATEGVVPEAFDQELLDSAWKVK